MSSANIRLPNSKPADARLQLASSAQINAGDISLLTKQILKGSKSEDTLGQAQRTFASAESNISNCDQTLQKLSALVSHLGYQEEAIEKSIMHTEDVCKMLNFIKSQTPN